MTDMKMSLQPKGRLYSQGRFSVDRVAIDHTRFDGTMATGVVRDVFRRGNSAAAILYDPYKDKLVWVEQFRVGVAVENTEATHTFPWIMEPVAGSLEGDADNPLQRIKAECLEECGGEPWLLFEIPGFYPSPGACSEFIHMFLGFIDADKVAEHGGLAEHNEDIRVHVMTYDESVKMTKDGRLCSGPGLVGMLWLMANRAMVQGLLLKDPPK